MKGASGWGSVGNRRNELAVDGERGGGWDEGRKKTRLKGIWACPRVGQVWRGTCQFRVLSEWFHCWQEECAPVWIARLWGSVRRILFPCSSVFTFSAFVSASFVHHGRLCVLHWDHITVSCWDGCADGVSVPAVVLGWVSVDICKWLRWNHTCMHRRIT